MGDFWNTVKLFLTFVGVAMLALIIFVRPAQLGGESGGEQAGQIIWTGALGLAEVARAVTGDPSAGRTR